MQAERTKATPIKRNRSLTADTAWLLEIAERLKGGRIEIEPVRSVKKVRVILMHEEQGVALQGIGRNATEAMNELRGHIERMLEQGKR